MDALDIFPAAGIRFIPVAHEQGAAHMADGYARASGRHGVCIAQNGPGVTNFVTAIAAAYWRTRRSCSSRRDGLDDDGPRRLPGDGAAADLLEDHEVPGPRQQPEAHGGDRGPLLRPRDARDGPRAAQHPRDHFYGDIQAAISAPMRIGRGLATPRRSTRPPPCSLRRGSRSSSPAAGDHGGGIRSSRAARRTAARPVCNSYLHNDTFPARIRSGAVRSATRPPRPP